MDLIDCLIGGSIIGLIIGIIILINSKKSQKVKRSIY